ncbi:N-acetyltransferase [Bifidobacterium platyrrhinorum]|uniref:N-acetyltransferase n=1 Tax=Bifidobacterium platyrrhinorum TaxID=2661628 RepID=A0A6L9SUM4_9BIFI|nr:N-acetyltransferase [Bifidobacterium platyrrhinorum]NEG54861.1 N-acetyltransferase [Bifidobacterium platyrrhinorum]
MTDFTAPRKLTNDDIVEGFDCGLPVVNDWLHRHITTARKQGTAVAYGTFTGGTLAGFYTLSAFSMEHADASGWLRRNTPDPIPVILLGMLGVDVRFQTMHLGGQLLRDAVLRALGAADIIGARALVVEPATDRAATFYEHYGFRHITGSQLMFTPLNLKPVR